MTQQSVYGCQHRGTPENARRAYGRGLERSSPDGRTLASGGRLVQMVRHLLVERRMAPSVYGMRTQEHTYKRLRGIRLRGIRVRSTSVSFSPDGKTLASTGISIFLWDASTGAHLRALEVYDGILWDRFLSVSFSPVWQHTR